MYGEISSSSLCTDYQSRRLGIKYRDEERAIHYSHTLNGTGIAIPRMLITLLETYQTENMTIKIPKVLQSYMCNKKEIMNKKITI